MEQKPISEMSTKEILRKQLELLAEYSETTTKSYGDEVLLAQISLAMCELSKLINSLLDEQSILRTKTVNQIRIAHGLEAIEGGDIVLVKKE